MFTRVDDVELVADPNGTRVIFADFSDVNAGVIHILALLDEAPASLSEVPALHISHRDIEGVFTSSTTLSSIGVEITLAIPTSGPSLSQDISIDSVERYGRAVLYEITHTVEDLNIFTDPGQNGDISFRVQISTTDFLQE